MIDIEVEQKENRYKIISINAPYLQVFAQDDFLLTERMYDKSDLHRKLNIITCINKTFSINLILKGEV